MKLTEFVLQFGVVQFDVQAAALIRNGKVSLDGQVMCDPAMMIPDEMDIRTVTILDETFQLIED